MDQLDAPEILWKAYVDFETAEGERARCSARSTSASWTARSTSRCGYPSRSSSCERWRSTTTTTTTTRRRKRDEAARRRAAANGDAIPRCPVFGGAATRRARDVYERALSSLKENQPDAKEERVMLLEAWRAFEEGVGGGEIARRVEKKMPRRVKRKRPIYTDDGTPAGQEEYYDYIFPEEQGAAPNLKILEAGTSGKARGPLSGESGAGTARVDRKKKLFVIINAPTRPPRARH